MIYSKNNDKGLRRDTMSRLRSIYVKSNDDYDTWRDVCTEEWYLQVPIDFGLDDLDDNVFSRDFDKLIEFVDICITLFDYEVDKPEKYEGTLEFGYNSLLGIELGYNETIFIVNFLRSYYGL